MQRVEPPASAADLFEALVGIFPGFADWPGARPDTDDAPPTFHSVLARFLEFFGVAAPTASERQLRALAALVALSTAEPGPLENAFDTCFLEHLRQVRAEPYLRAPLAAARRARREPHTGT